MSKSLKASFLLNLAWRYGSQMLPEMREVSLGALGLRFCRPARGPRSGKPPQVLSRLLSRELSEIGVLSDVLPRVLLRSSQSEVNNKKSTLESTLRSTLERTPISESTLESSLGSTLGFPSFGPSGWLTESQLF